MTKQRAMARLLYVLSPAKTLDLTRPRVQQCSLPSMLPDAHELVTQLRTLPRAKLKALLGVSDALAQLNHARYAGFEFLDAAAANAGKLALEPSETHKQAVLSFNGPAYLGLAADELSKDQLEYAQHHLRILCGLYGILRPLDLIQAYRLEMGIKLATARGKDLYAFWGARLAEAINAGFAQAGAKGAEKILVNVASQEYFKSIDRDALDGDVRVIECVFKDNGSVKGVYAKRARGLMCRYLITNKVDSVDGIKKFDLEGYVFSAKESDDTTFVFNRSPAKQKEVLKKIQAKAKRRKEQLALATSEKQDGVKEESTYDGGEEEDVKETKPAGRKRRRVARK